MIVIDYFGDDDLIDMRGELKEESHEVKMERFRKLREEWLKRAPQPALQIVPVTVDR